MSASAIGAASSNVNSSNAFGGMKSKDFIRILTSELANQDPFKPQDSSALLDQISSLRNIESQLSLQKQFENLVGQNQVAMAGNMVGKTITGLDSRNETVQGIVTAIRIENGKATLELDTGKSLKMDQITRITETLVG